MKSIAFALAVVIALILAYLVILLGWRWDNVNKRERLLIPILGLVSLALFAYFALV